MNFEKKLEISSKVSADFEESEPQTQVNMSSEVTLEPEKKKKKIT